MDTRVIEISSCFRYTTEMGVRDIIVNAKKILDIEYNEYQKNSFMIITKPIDYTYDVIQKFKKNNPDGFINTDCRFFAMFISNLMKYPKTGNLFTMYTHENNTELEVPESCLYLTLDKDIFKINTRGNPPTLLSKLLNTDQGMWITKIDTEKDKYLGINSDGVITMSLEKWVEKYKQDVRTHIERSDKNLVNNKLDLIYTCYNGVLKCLCEKHGICVSAYKFNKYYLCDNSDYVVDILKKNVSVSNSSTINTISV